MRKCFVVVEALIKRLFGMDSLMSSSYYLITKTFCRNGNIYKASSCYAFFHVTSYYLIIKRFVSEGHSKGVDAYSVIKYISSMKANARIYTNFKPYWCSFEKHFVTIKLYKETWGNPYQRDTLSMLLLRQNVFMIR